MLEYHLLRAMLDPETYQRWKKDVKPESLSTPAKEVWAAMRHWHGQGCPGTLAAHQGTVLHTWGADRVASFVVGLEHLEGLKVEVPSDSIVRTWLEREAAAELAEIADRFIAEPEKFTKGFKSVVDKYHTRLTNDAQRTGTTEEVDYTMQSFDQLFEQLAGDGTVKWRLDCLNASIGPIYPGLFVVFGGRMESGKTTLLASEIAWMIRQMPEESTVVWFNNEQSKPAVEFRLKQAVLRSSRDRIKEDPTAAEEAFNKQLAGRRILVINVFNRSIHDVERILEKLENVELIIFDQASKLGGFEKNSANEADRLLKLSARLKSMSTEIAPVFTTIWADASAEGEMWIGQGQLYGSKTGIPGEAEAVVTVGHTGEESDAGVRFINIPKNKSMTCQDERQRHGKFTVLIDGVTAEFKNPE